MNLRMFMGYLLILLIGAFMISACEGPVGPQGETGAAGEQGDPGLPGSSDKQIRLGFEMTGGFGISSDTARVIGPSVYITNFDKRNYAGVDSIVFSALLTPDDSTYFAHVELYNVTDGVPIANSDISTNSYQWVESGNIYDDLPDKAIDLSFQIRLSSYGGHGSLRRAVLFLYR